MTNFDKHWEKGLKAKAKEKRRAEKKAAAEQELIDAQKVILEIPRLIAAAIDKGKKYCAVTGWIEGGDLAASLPYRKSSYEARFNWERFAPHRLYRKVGETVLSAELFTGRIRRIIIWCNQNGLECFLGPYRMSDPNDNDEYNLCVRPK